MASPARVPSDAGSAGSGRAAMSRVVADGEVMKPGLPARSVAQASPCRSTLPSTMNGICS